VSNKPAEQFKFSLLDPLDFGLKLTIKPDLQLIQPKGKSN